jgi:hypothetical protein
VRLRLQKQQAQEIPEMPPAQMEWFAQIMKLGLFWALRQCHGNRFGRLKSKKTEKSGAPRRI